MEPSFARPSSRRLAIVLLASGLVLGQGCSGKSDTHNVPLEDCTEQCGSPGSTSGSGQPVGGGGGSAGSSGSAGSGTSGTGGTGGAATGVAMSGKVVSIIDTDFVTATAYTQAALVTAPGASKQTAAGMWSGTGTFSLVDVLPGLQWVHTSPISVGDALASYTLVDVKADKSFDAVVVQPTVLTAVLGQLPVGQPLSAEAGHAVLFLVDDAGKPVSGATIATNFTSTIAYDDGASYGQTSSKKRGVALVLNAQGLGTQNEITLTGPTGTKGSLVIPLEKATVTFLSVVVK